MTERSYQDGFTKGEHDAWNDRGEPVRNRPAADAVLTDFQRGWWDAQFARTAEWLSEKPLARLPQSLEEA